MPIYRKFVVYAPVKFGRYSGEFTIDLTIWADNVPLTITRYKISHRVENEQYNWLKAELVFENRPAYEITLEDGQSEQDIIRAQCKKCIEAFGSDYTSTPLGKKLLN